MVPRSIPMTGQSTLLFLASYWNEIPKKVRINNFLIIFLFEILLSLNSRKNTCSILIILFKINKLYIFKYLYTKSIIFRLFNNSHY